MKLAGLLKTLSLLPLLMPPALMVCKPGCAMGSCVLPSPAKHNASADAGKAKDHDACPAHPEAPSTPITIDSFNNCCALNSDAPVAVGTQQLSGFELHSTAFSFLTLAMVFRGAAAARNVTGASDISPPILGSPPIYQLITLLRI